MKGSIHEGIFEGRVSITGFAYDAVPLVASGTAYGIVRTQGGLSSEVHDQRFMVRATLERNGGGRCTSLRLLPKSIYLSAGNRSTIVEPISIAFTKSKGQNQALVNLLCQLASRLNAGSDGAVQALISNIIDVLVGKDSRVSTPKESTFFSTVFIEEASIYNTLSDGDLWPSAWSDDDALYSVNGDGKGFDLEAPWSDIVVNRVDGHPDERNLMGERLAGGDDVGPVWGDSDKYNRKPTGIVSVSGVLYLAVQDLNKENSSNIFNEAPAATILRSDDKGRTWQWDEEAPMFSDHMFTTIMFLDYGKDSGDNLFDDYVYAYGLDYNWRDSFNDVVEDPTKLYLARMPKDAVQDRSCWEFYTGDLNGKASWSVPGDITSRQPVLQDERRVYEKTLFPVQPSNLSVLSQGSVVYNKPLNRYLYTSWTEYTFEFYEAPTPWGPWKRFISKDFGIYPWFPAHHGGYATVIPSKFISSDGRIMWLNSNTFVSGIHNYNLLLRKLYVTPYRPTVPTNAPSDANLALHAHSQDVTPISKASVHYGNVWIVNNGLKDGSEDSWNGEAKEEDYWGYTWSQAYNLNAFVYTTGRMFGADGGWFEDIRVQVRQNFVWRDVEDLAAAPAYPGDGGVGTNATYTFTFKNTWGDGIRIIGKPGGIGAFTSVAELAVHYLPVRAD